MNTAAELVLKTLTILAGLTRVLAINAEGFAVLRLVDATGAQYGASALVCQLVPIAGGVEAMFSTDSGRWLVSGGVAGDELLALTLPQVDARIEALALTLADDERARLRYLASRA